MSTTLIINSNIIISNYHVYSCGQLLFFLLVDKKKIRIISFLVKYDILGTVEKKKNKKFILKRFYLNIWRPLENFSSESNVVNIKYLL